jgi:biopolymer transport protein TolR
MAMDLGGAKGGVKSDINVTPLVDVMLVLLIIMMVVAPMLNQGVPLTLPEADNASPKPDTSDQTVVSVDGSGYFYVNAVGPISKDDVPKRLQDIFDQKGQKIVFLKGDTDAPYGAIMDVMDALRKAQIDTVALITERKKGKPQGGN